MSLHHLHLHEVISLSLSVYLLSCQSAMLEYERQFSVCEFGYYVPSCAMKQGIVRSLFPHHVQIETNSIVL
jgi:hypothetical protein